VLLAVKSLLTIASHAGYREWHTGRIPGILIPGLGILTLLALSSAGMSLCPFDKLKPFRAGKIFGELVLKWPGVELLLARALSFGDSWAF